MNTVFDKVKLLFTILVILLFASQAFGAAGEVLEVNGSEVIIEGDSVCSKGDELVIYDYGGKKVARVKIKMVIINQNSTEYLCEIISSDSDIKEGFSSKITTSDKGFGYVEYGKLDVKVNQNRLYNQVTGEIPPLNYGDTYVVRIGFLVNSKDYIGGQFYTNFSVSYMDIGPYNILTFEVGAMKRFSIMPRKGYLAFGVLGGIGFNGKMKWARPEGTYDDKIGKNSGETTDDSFSGSLQAWSAFTYNLSSRLGLRFKAAYFTFFTNSIDSEKPTDVSEGDEALWDIKDQWLEVDVNKYGIEVGMSLLVNFF